MLGRFRSSIALATRLLAFSDWSSHLPSSLAAGLGLANVPKGGSPEDPPFKACTFEGRVWCPTRVQEFEVEGQGSVWDGYAEAQG